VEARVLVQRVGAHHLLIDALPCGQADGVGTQRGVDLERAHRDAVGERQAPPEVALARAPFEHRRGGGRDVAGEGLDLQALAARYAVVEACVAGRKFARGQVRHPAGLSQVGEFGHPGGEPGLAGLGVIAEVLDGGVVEPLQCRGERRPLVAPRRTPEVKRRRPP